MSDNRPNSGGWRDRESGGWRHRVSDIILAAVKEYPDDTKWRGSYHYADEIREAMGGPEIEVRQQDWIPGFAAYLSGGDPDGHAHVVLNLGSIMAMVEEGDLDPSDVPYLVAESIMHEVIHALEDWAGVEFSEDRVEALLDDYREFARPNQEDVEP